MLASARPHGKGHSVIVDVEPDEANLLIELIETVFKDWYIAREEKARLTSISTLASQKNAARK